MCEFLPSILKEDTKNKKKNETAVHVKGPCAYQTPQGYKEPFEQMDSNSCKLGVVPNVHGADVCRVPQSESDPTLSRSLTLRLQSPPERRLWPLFSCSSTLLFNSFNPNYLLLFFFSLLV